MVENENVIHDPDSANANIHGLVSLDGQTTCRISVKNERLCTGCCFSSDQAIMGNKCIQQIPEAGCVYDLLKTPSLKPRSCQEYHCSYDLQALNDDVLPLVIQEESYLRVASANLASRKAGEIDGRQFKVNQKRIGMSPVPLTPSRMITIQRSNDKRTPQLERLILLTQIKSI